MPSLSPTRWNETRLKYRLPGWQKDAAAQGTAVQRLSELEDQENARLTLKAQGGPFASGYTGEKDYTAGLNRQGEIADLKSRLTGRGPATIAHSYAGTDFASGGSSMGPAAQALRRAGRPGDYPAPATSGDDDLIEIARRKGMMDIEDRLTGRYDKAVAELEPDEDRKLALGITGEQARRRGDIARGEHVRNEEARGLGEVAKYQAPGAGTMRRGQMWDEEERLRRTAPLQPSVINSANRLTGTLAGADARVGAAEVGGDARRDSAAIQALARLGSAPTFTPEDRAARDSATGAIQPNVPGQTPAAGGAKVFPRARLAAFAQQNGFQSEQAAAEFLQTVHGYTVR